MTSAIDNVENHNEIEIERMINNKLFRYTCFCRRIGKEIRETNELLYFLSDLFLIIFFRYFLAPQDWDDPHNVRRSII